MTDGSAMRRGEGSCVEIDFGWVDQAHCKVKMKFESNANFHCLISFSCLQDIVSRNYWKAATVECVVMMSLFAVAALFWRR